MAKDASFETIESISPHPNADKLEIAKISGWNVIVAKNEFSVGDVVFYIREDAKLIEFDNLTEFAKKHPADEYKYAYPWQKNLLRYLGSGGRVKTIKLRGEYSSGIAVKLADLFAHINSDAAKNWEADNVRLNSDNASGFLSGKYGVRHWEMPIRNIGDLQARGGLPYSVPKSDEENFQNLKRDEIPFGETVLITKKLDGTSTTVIAFPDGKYHVCSRSMDLNVTCDNIYIQATKPIVGMALAWAKHYNKPIALRGETCASNIQKMSFNKDKDVPCPTFNLYGVFMIDEKEWALRNGLYGTEYHFLNVAKQIEEITGEKIRTVPILGEVVLTEDVLNEYLNKPLDFGEGVVINTRKNHFKCKSLAYLEALSKSTK